MPENQEKADWKTIWGILSGRPDHYQESLAALVSKGEAPNRLIVFPMTVGTASRLHNMRNIYPLGSKWDRDQRLLAWSKACLALGATPIEAVRTHGPQSPEGFSALFGVKAFETLEWWRGQGAEEVMALPEQLSGGVATTFATLAFIKGNLPAMHRLVKGSRLTHPDQLWGLIWSKECIQCAPGLIDALMPASRAPPHVFSLLAKARVSNRNASAVVEAAHKLLRHGYSVDASLPGEPSPLTTLLRGMRSPVCRQLVDLFLEAGADPERSSEGDLEDAPAFAAFDRFRDTHPSLAVRRTCLECFGNILMKCSPEYVEKHSPQIEARVEGLFTSDQLYRFNLIAIDSFWQSQQLSEIEAILLAARTRNPFMTVPRPRL